MPYKEIILYLPKILFVERTMYHTQESRQQRLSSAIICKKDDAWLGEGYYFWKDIFDADRWGNTLKRKTGYYEIYQCNVKSEDILDTVFNEEHYDFWLAQIEKVGKKIVKETGGKPTLKELNDYFKEKGQWNTVDGILFQDLPENNNFLIVKPIRVTKTRVASFCYRKRIQLVVFNSNIINNFTFLKREQVTEIQ